MWDWKFRFLMFNSFYFKSIFSGVRYRWRYSALLFHEASAASMPSRAPNMWVNLIWQTPKCRCVWFVYVGEPSLPFRSVIFRLCMLLSAAFMSPLIPWCCTGAALNCHAGCSMYKTHTHRTQVPPLHPQPPLVEINNLRASKTHSHTHTRTCAHGRRCCFLALCFLRRAVPAHEHPNISAEEGFM